MLCNHVSESSAAIKTENFLAMLVESGFAYCCIWARHRSLFPLYISGTYPWGRTGALSNIDIPGITRPLLRCHERLYSIYRGSCLCFSAEFLLCSDPSCGCGQGLYPTIIILFVVLQKTPTFVITSERASVHFSDVPSSVEVRIPMSEIYSQPEGTHTDSEMTVLHSPSLYARSKP